MSNATIKILLMCALLGGLRTAIFVTETPKSRLRIGYRALVEGAQQATARARTMLISVAVYVIPKLQKAWISTLSALSVAAHDCMDLIETRSGAPQRALFNFASGIIIAYRALADVISLLW
jgi:hypothetical protein